MEGTFLNERCNGVRSVSHLKARYEWVSQSACAQRAELLQLPRCTFSQIAFQ